jgi:hypothetical protein
MHNADDDWRPSLFDVVRFAAISIRHEERRLAPQPVASGSLSRPWDYKYTADQLKQAMVLRKFSLSR